MSLRTQNFLSTLKRWVDSFPSGTVQMIEGIYPPDDASELYVELKPLNPDACAILVGFDYQDDMSHKSSDQFVGVTLGSWLQIARRLGLYTPRKDLAVLGVFGPALTAEQAMTICRAVSQGEFRPELGLIGRRLIYTAGQVGPPDVQRFFSGVGNFKFIVRTLSLVHAAEIRKYTYVPWIM